MSELLRDSVAIVGVGVTPFGPLYRERDAQRSPYDLAKTAFVAALDDAGIERDAVDGLLCARLPSYTRMADLLGIRRPRFCNGFDGSGRMSAVTVQVAAMAIQSGLAGTVACVYGNNGRSGGATYGGEEPTSPTGRYDAAYGMTSPGAYVALMYQRYIEQYKVPDGALAPLAINNRSNAKLNPNAVMRADISENDYMGSSFIAEPLRLFDYCLINDGGVALILTSTERAKKLGRPVVTLSASATCGDLTNFYTSDDFFYTSCQDVANRVYADAGVVPGDVRCAQIYDNFTPTILFSLEGFGFCERGTAWRWIRDGRLGAHDGIALNTSGGHTSESYMQGWALHVEAVRQLRGEAGDRQVPGCDLVQYICAAPITNAHIMRRIA